MGRSMHWEILIVKSEKRIKAINTMLSYIDKYETGEPERAAGTHPAGAGSEKPAAPDKETTGYGTLIRHLFCDRKPQASAFFFATKWIYRQRERHCAAHVGIMPLFSKIMYLVQMLMYGKEASNRKQEIDRQHHTIPNKRNKRPKDSQLYTFPQCRLRRNSPLSFFHKTKARY